MMVHASCTMMVVAVSAFTPPHRGGSSRRAPAPRLALGGRGTATDLTPGEDLFLIVGVDRGCTDAEIRAAYRQRARILHPDTSSAADAPADFRRLSAATEILLSAGEKRREEWPQTAEGGTEWTMDTEWTLDPEAQQEDDGGWQVATKKWGPVWSAVIAPWLSWHLFVAIDTAL